MKIALYIEDGREQIVLTPETKTERSILDKLHEGQRQLSVRRGAFYGCQGGWTRHARSLGSAYLPDRTEDESTMLVLDAIKGECE